MPKITHEQNDEYYQLKKERSALDQLMSKMAAYEAAVRVIVRHDLMMEFASEIATLSETNGQ